jgi:AraC family transcriptional regulator
MGNSEFRSWNVTALPGFELLFDKNCPEYPSHVHDAFTIDIIETGYVRYSLGGITHSVGPGNIVWIDAHQVHSAVQIGPEPVTIRSILVPEAFLFDFHQNINPIPSIISDDSLHEELKRFHRNTESVNVAGAEGKLLEIIKRILVYPSDVQKTEHQLIQQVKKYMLAHYMEPISIDELAGNLQLNKSYFVRMFRDHVGLPPYGYLTQIRVARARVLLARGMSPAEVAASVGLSDQSHLTRFFKRSTGMTPAFYARMRT